MKLTIPFYLHKVGAGFPSPATDYIEDDLDLNTHLINNAPATFIIRVQGRSMRDVGIYDGDLLIVDKTINNIKSLINYRNSKRWNEITRNSKKQRATCWNNRRLGSDDN